MLNTNRKSRRQGLKTQMRLADSSLYWNHIFLLPHAPRISQHHWSRNRKSMEWMIISSTQGLPKMYNWISKWWGKLVDKCSYSKICHKILARAGEMIKVRFRKNLNNKCTRYQEVVEKKVLSGNLHLRDFQGVAFAGVHVYVCLFCCVVFLNDKAWARS